MKNKKTPGQIVVILTLVLAILILLTIVFINIAKVSDIKTNTSQIADSGTLRLCSQLAAYSNVIYQKLAQRNGFGCFWVSARAIECVNWGLIIPLGAILLAIVLMAFGPAGWIFSAILSFIFINPLLSEVNNIMKGGFSNAAAELTQYSAMRETSIAAMLQQAQFDDVYAEMVTPGRYQYSEQYQDPVTHAWIGRVYNYDLTQSPVTAKIQNMPRIPRFAAWYWSMRYPLVTEARLAPYIEAFINNGLLPITEFNVWDPVKWNYDEVSLKVPMPAAEITCHSGSCPDWVNKEENFVRIIGHVTRQEPDPLIEAKAWLGLVTGSGFLAEQFIPLTTRLLQTNTYRSMISYATPGFDVFKLLSIGYNFDKVLEVIEALRGLMVRDMELLNLPVAHRIPTVDNWLRVWYNRDDHSEDIYTRLTSVVIPRLEQWRSELAAIDAIMRPWIKNPNGTCCHYGVLANTCSDCEIHWCCDCSDCSCFVCCDPAPCAWDGDYCSCSHSNICEGAGDLYLHKAHSPHGCPLDNMDPGCTCDRCKDVWAAGAHEESCRFQGDYTWAHFDGPSEVGQAVRILEEFIIDLNTLTEAIENFATEAYAVLYPCPATCALQKEAVYGWHDDDNKGNLNLVRVLLEGYPAREDLPHIKESYAWGGFAKRWEIIGDLSGEDINVTVSRYSSDVSVGVLPSRWWNLRYRANPAGAEWDKGQLMGLIDNIQTSATIAVPADAWKTYAITSATRGYYGLRKEDVRIERIK